MTNKKIVQYTSVTFIGLAFGLGTPVGHGARVLTIDHPSFTLEEQSTGGGLDTSRVTSYDETTGIFETLNTVYVPAGADNSSQA